MEIHAVLDIIQEYAEIGEKDSAKTNGGHAVDFIMNLRLQARDQHRRIRRPMERRSQSQKQKLRRKAKVDQAMWHGRQ